MIRGYCKENCLREACDIFNDMKLEGIKLDVLLRTFFNAHLKKIKKKFFYIYFSLLEGGDGNGHKTQHCTFYCYDFKALQGKRPSSCFYEMTDKELEPNTVTYTTLLYSYLGKGDVHL